MHSLQEELKRMPSPESIQRRGWLEYGEYPVRPPSRRPGPGECNGDEVNRDQYNLRIDHNFNSKHKLSFMEQTNILGARQLRLV
jgi:hypothetical protein